MDNPRPEKVAVVDEVRERLSAADAAILTEYRGLSVKDLATLRRSLVAAGGTYKVYKNTLVTFAVRDLGLVELESMLQGPTAIAFVEGDAVEVAKALRDFSKTHPLLVVKGGVLGQSVLSSADAAALADVPPREVLLARIAGAFAAPMVQFAGLLEALPRNFAYGLKALLEKMGGAPETTSAADAAPADAAPADEAPADEAPADEAPADEAPADEAPADEAPADEAPAGEAPIDAAPDVSPEAEEAETPADEAPAAVEEPAAAPAAEVPAVTEEPVADAPADEAPAVADAPADADEPAAADDTAGDAGLTTASTDEPAEGAADADPPADDDSSTTDPAQEK